MAPSTANAAVPMRNVVFPLPKGESRYAFYEENALASMMFVVLSSVFPEGEQFFVRSVKHFKSRIDDRELVAKIVGFAGQESLHGREHQRLNDWFVARGIDVDTPVRGVRRGLGHLARLSPEMQLACTALMEHFTTHLAEQWLTNEEFRSSSDADLLPLWSWHALEELEHKSVAFEVYEAIGGTWTTRCIAVPLVVVALVPELLASWAVLLWREGGVGDLEEHRRGLRALFGRDGFLTRVFRRIPDWFDRDFHPDQHDTRALADTWRKRLFGEDGTLRPHLRSGAT